MAQLQSIMVRVFSYKHIALGSVSSLVFGQYAFSASSVDRIVSAD